MGMRKVERKALSTLVSKKSVRRKATTKVVKKAGTAIRWPRSSIPRSYLNPGGATNPPISAAKRRQKSMVT